VKWQDLDAQFPASFVGDIEGAASHVARLAIALPVRGVTREGVLYTVRKANNWALKLNYDEDAWRGMLALIAGYYGDWDLVSQVTGGDALGTRVLPKKTFGANTKAFARHLATACARKLPADQLAVAMAEQHQRFIDGTSVPDGRVAAIAAHIYIRELAIVSDVSAATKSWLDGTFVLEAAAPAANAVADGEDARIKIFNGLDCAPIRKASVRLQIVQRTLTYVRSRSDPGSSTRCARVVSLTSGGVFLQTTPIEAPIVDG
jgi:hypothetical protein